MFEMDNKFESGFDFPLHEAAQRGDGSLLKTLIKESHNINIGNWDEVTPLHAACLSGHVLCVKLLLESGANVHARNIDGATPLCDACNNGNLVVIQLLLDHGAFVNPALNLTTPLHEAVLQDNREVIDLLIRVGSNLEASDLHFGRPLHCAAYRNYTQCARVLLVAGADVNAAKTHETSLHVACINDNVEMCRVLLEFGANIYAENAYGRKSSQIVSCRSPLHKFLKIQEGKPRSLQEICRFTIRYILSPQRLLYIEHLPLPKYLIRFVEFR